MTKVTRLTEYMEIICDRPYTRDENHIISQNELAAIYDEFKSLLSGVEEAKIKSSQKRTSNDKLSAFIKQFAIQLYDYAYKIKSAKDSRNPDAKEQAFFYRGVNNASYLIAPGMERMRGILNQNEFDEELVHELIKRIYVGMDNSVEVEFKCSDPYQEVLAIMSEVQNE